MRNTNIENNADNSVDYKFIIFLSIITLIFIIFIPQLLYLVIFVVAIIFIKKGQNKEEKNEPVKIEEKKLNEMKIKLFENQKKLRNIQSDSKKVKEKEKNKAINDVLEDMCIYGTITKQEIREEKIKNPEKFIDTTQALKMENKDEGLFALGLISNSLEKLGIETAIEIDSNPDIQDADVTSLQFLTNGMITKKKYDLHFEFGDQRNDELLNNKAEFEKFKKNLKLKLSKDYNIPSEKIIVTLPQKGSLHVQVIFQSQEFNDLNKTEFIQKFKDDKEFAELQNLKDIHEDMIMGAVRLTKNNLDPRGNRNSGWGVGLENKEEEKITIHL